MGFIHDRVEAAGHQIDYLCADDVPPAWTSWYGRRIAFPMAVRAKAIDADRAGRPYDIVNVHEPCAAPVLIGRRVSSSSVVITSHGLERRAWELAKEEGLLVGVSSGAALAATLRVASTLTEGVVVTVFCDGGEKYLSQPFWDEP